MATIAESSGEVLRSERIAGGILSKVLNTFDMVAIFIAIVFFITNSPGIASAGPVAYIYLVVGFLTSGQTKPSARSGAFSQVFALGGPASSSF
ncbi:MAG: hypothetical protein E6I93_14100 [Chloroflexi bacterium]|nr:MAG: hypothetical protein E6I93_14100 [Chloroflexota bacterium]